MSTTDGQYDLTAVSDATYEHIVRCYGDRHRIGALAQDILDGRGR